MDLNLALDTDGVILNCDESYRQFAETVFNKPLPKLSTDYWFESRYGLTTPEVDYAWKRFEEAGMWRQMKPYDGAIEAVNALYDAGFKIHIVTAIQHHLKYDRIANFEALGIKFHEIHTAGGYKEDKVAILNQINAGVLVDDRLSHLKAALEGAPAIRHRVYVDQGNTQDVEEDESIYHHKTTSLVSWAFEFLKADRVQLTNLFNQTMKV